MIIKLQNAEICICPHPHGLLEGLLQISPPPDKSQQLTRLLIGYDLHRVHHPPSRGRSSAVLRILLLLEDLATANCKPGGSNRVNIPFPLYFIPHPSSAMGASEAAWSSSIPTRESADTADSTRPLLSKYPENEDEPDAPAKSDIPVAVAVGPRVEYVYKPIYPRTGDRQDAVGIIGKTRRVS
jgi:hypothetical protein